MSRAGRGAGTVSAALVGAAGAVLAAVLANGTGQALDVWVVAAVVIVYLGVSTVVCLARPAERLGWVMLAGSSAWGVGEGLLALGVRGLVAAPGSIPAADWLGVLGTAIRGAGWLVLVLAVPLLFPDGHLPWPGRRWPAAAIVASITGFFLATLLAPTPLESRLERFDSPTGLPASWQLPADLLALGSVAFALVCLGVAVAGLVHRWRVGDRLRRQQLLWFGAAFALPLFFLPIIATDFASPWMFGLVVLPVPLAIAAALFQRRLYDIQFVISRSLTALLLSLAVAGLYAVTVGGVGALIGRRGAPWLGFVAAGVVAVSFAPLHSALRRGVNRLTFGQWSQPAEVLAATGRRLADANDVPALLQTLVDEMATGLSMDSVWVTDASGAVLARHGTREDGADESALTAYGLPVGTLHWQGDHLRETDRALVAQVADQIGGVVHAAGLLDSLQQARERLVLSGEEERRRLRRDLHDGLGPELAALTMRVDTLRNQLGVAGLDLDGELVRLRTGIQSTVSSVRRVVDGLRPPAVDELGLPGALEQLADGLAGGPDIVLDLDPVPPLSAASEVAVYRVAQEALTNALKHASAARVIMVLRTTGNALVLTVSDDGVGFEGPRDGGVGLGSMRERAAEVGGSLEVVAGPGGATTVTLEVPLTGDPAPHEAQVEAHVEAQAEPVDR